MGGRGSQREELAPGGSAGRIAVGLTLALLIFSCGGLMAMCAGVEVSANLVIQPVVAVFAIFFAGLFGLPYLGIILWLDRNDPEPWYLIVSALVWGGVLATGLSGIFNEIFGAGAGVVVSDPAMALQLTASISAPFVEEITKGMALLMLYFFFRKHFDNVLDGVVYGALIGLGFAVFENFTYYVNQEHGVAGVFVMTWIRGVVSAAGGSHATFTALTGLGFGLFRSLRRGYLRWLLPPLGLAAAMFLHFSWNTFAQVIMGIAPGGELGGIVIGLPLAVVVIQVPFLFFVLVTAFFALRHENKLIRRFLSEEEAPVVNAGEIDRLVPARWRTVHALKLLLTLRLRTWWRTRSRNHMLVRLAFEKWHTAGELKGDDTREAREHRIRTEQLREALADYQIEGAAPG